MGMFDTPGTSPDLDFENQEGYGEEGADNQSGDDNENRNPELEQAGSEQPGDQPPEDGNGDLILGKYKTQEEFQRAHEALLTRLGQMRNGLGQLRQLSTAGQMQPSNRPMNPHSGQTSSGDSLTGNSSRNSSKTQDRRYLTWLLA